MSLLDKLASTVAAGKGLTLTAADVRILHEAVELMAALQVELRRNRVGIKDGLRQIADAIHGTLTDEELVEHAYRVTNEAGRQALAAGTVDPLLRNAAEELQDLIEQLAEHDSIVTRVQLRRLDRKMFGLGVPHA